MPYLVLIAACLIVFAWVTLRGDACLACGKDYGTCPHTKRRD